MKNLVEFLYRFRLRAFVPLAIVFFAAGISIFLYKYNVSTADREVEESVTGEALHDLAGLQGSLERRLNEDDTPGARAELLDIGANDNLESAMMLDEQGGIVLSTRLSDVGRTSGEVLPGLDAKAVKAVKESMSAQVHISKDRGSAEVYFPVLIGNSGGVRPTRTGILYARYDLGPPKAAMRAKAYHRMIILVSSTGVFCALLWAFFHFSLTRRVSRLIKAANGFASGDLDARSGFQGSDELAVVGQAFDRMADDVARAFAERSRAEGKINEQREFLERTIESLTHPFYVIDAANYEVVMANSAARLDVSRGINTCYALTHKMDRPCSGVEHICPLQTIKKTKQATSVEHIHYDKDNNEMVVEIHGYPILDDKGNVVQMIEYAMDITKRKQAENALRESGEKYRALVDITNTGYVILNMAGAVVDANDEYVRLTGHKALDEIIGRNVVEWTAPADIDRNAVEVKKCLEKGYVRNLEINYAGPDGRVTPIEINANIVHDTEGGKILTLCRDITERKRAEEELHRLNEELEQRVEERTAELVDKNSELERMNRLFVGRELRMVELKERIKQLEAGPEEKEHIPD